VSRPFRYDPPRWQTKGTYCINAAAHCDHNRHVHKEHSDGSFRECSGVNGDGSSCTCRTFIPGTVRR